MLSSKISAKDVDPSLINDLGGATKSYVDQQVINISQTGIPKLMVYPFSIVAETEGQTVFEIPLDTFDANADTVFVQSGRTMISPNEDFSVVDNSVVLTEGVPVERVITIYVFKNVPIGEDGSVSGSVIMPGSLTLDRLSALPTAEQVGALPDTGGTLKGDIILKKANNGYGEIMKNHSETADYGTGIADYNSSGKGVSLSVRASEEKIYFNTSTDAHEIYGEHNKDSMPFLPLTGGTLSGLLSATSDIVVNHFTHITGNEETSCLRAIRPDGSSRGIEVVNSSTGIEDKYAARFTTCDGATWKTSHLFGTHNKPTGSYTGNGSATSRTIDIGGLTSTTSVLFVVGGGYSFIVMPNGAIGFHFSTSTIKHFLQSEFSFLNGVLTIATSDVAVNESGKLYHFGL